MLLQVREVSKTYLYANNQKHVVLNRVSIDINDGEFVSIVGPSGCGKSTFLNIIAGLDRQDCSSIVVKGKHKTSTDPGRLVIFQEGARCPGLSVVEDVEFALKLARVP